MKFYIFRNSVQKFYPYLHGNYYVPIASITNITFHGDVIQWNHFPRYWPFVWGIHRWPVNSPHKGQWRDAWMFSLICAWINGWENNREGGDLRRHRAHYDVTWWVWHCFVWNVITNACPKFKAGILWLCHHWSLDVDMEWIMLYMAIITDPCSWLMLFHWGRYPD